MELMKRGLGTEGILIIKMGGDEDVRVEWLCGKQEQ